MSTEPPGAPDSGDRLHRYVKAAWIAAAVIVAFVATGVGATYVTAAPELCGSCHAMAPSVASWRQSSHSTVGCPACHETARPWYRFPETLAARGVMLTRDTAAVVAPGMSRMTSATVTDATCEQCHDSARRVTMRYGTLIDHKEHAKRNRSCLSCHEWTAHPRPGAEKPLLMMEKCFNCHGTAAKPKASAECTACHPASFDKRPASHAPSSWKKGHSKVALAGQQKCTMCHTPAFCTKCHGVEMPHPAGWDRGKTGHGVAASKGRKVCETCHTEKPDMCGMCHHTDYEPQKGPWIAQHPLSVEEQGVPFCLKCHEPTHCIGCHTKSGKSEGVFAP